MTNLGKKQDITDDGSTISISELIKLQDRLKKDFDPDKPQSEMSTEEITNKVMYSAIDEILEKNLGKDHKKDLDEKRKIVDNLSKFQAGLGRLAELGREIERNFIWHQAYLINHFDQAEKNKFRLIIDGMTTDLVDPNKQMSSSERIQFAKKILEIIDVYRNKIIKELLAKEEIILALIPAFEKQLTQTDFDVIGMDDNRKNIKEMELQFKEWLRLSKELFSYRRKATEAVKEKVEIDEIIPRIVIENGGDITKNFPMGEMKMKGERMIRLIGEADKVEKEITTTRLPLSEQLFGKSDDYMSIDKESDPNKESIPTGNPLQVKAWFRLLKVTYIIALVISILVGILLMSNDSTTGFWFIVVVVIIFVIIKKAFYYVTLGKTNWK